MRYLRLLATAFLLISMAACGGGGGASSSPVTPPKPPANPGTLAFTTTSLPEGVTNRSYAASIEATGGVGTLYYSIYPGSSLPPGLTLNSSTGAISGVVTNAGWGDVTFQVTDAAAQIAMRTFRMRFSWNLDVTKGAQSLDGTVGVPYYVQFFAGSSSGGATSWSVLSGQLPPGLSLATVGPSEANLIGIPTQRGTYSFTLQAVDSSANQKDTYSATVVIDDKFAIATVDLPTPFLNETYNQMLSAVNGTPPYHWSKSPNPSFFTLDPSIGLLSGTPSGYFYSSFSVAVTDSSSPAKTASRIYWLEILPRMSLRGGTLSNGRRREYYHTSLPRDGGAGALKFSIVSGVLPPGLNLDPQYGSVSGTPTQMGSYSFTVVLTDSSKPQQRSEATFSLAITEQTLRIPNGSLPSRIPAGVPFNGTVATTGGAAPMSWSITNGSLPQGLSLDPSTGRITGTPNTAGTYSFSVKVVDSSSPSQQASSAYSLTVVPSLGRNDIPAKATAITNGSYVASISPLVTPPTSLVLSPDTDYYRITGVGTAVIKVSVLPKTSNGYPMLDPVLEFVDANGARLNACRLPGDTSQNFNSPCMNDDLRSGDTSSQLEYRVPGTATDKTDIFAHVLDWRGDARPDMGYSLQVDGAFNPIVFSPQSLPDAAEDKNYYQSITAKGGKGYLTGKFDQLPAGMNQPQPSSFYGEWWGYLSGQLKAGDYTFTVTVSDQGVPQQTVSRTYNLHVNPKLILDAIPDQTLNVGQKVVIPAHASGGLAPYKWAMSPALNGFTINPTTGEITLQPTAAGTYSFWVSVTDSGISSGQASVGLNLKVTVNP